MQNPLLYTSVCWMRDVPNSAQGTPTRTPAEQALAYAIEDVFGSRGVNAKSFGYWARRVQGAYIDGFILAIQHDPSTNANVCSVRCSP